MRLKSCLFSFLFSSEFIVFVENLKNVLPTIETVIVGRRVGVLFFGKKYGKYGYYSVKLEM